MPIITRIIARLLWASGPIEIFRLPGIPAGRTKTSAPYAEVDWDFAWDKGTKYEEHHATINMIYVPKKMRGQGLGMKLLNRIVAKAKKRGVKELWFDNFADDFWESAEKKFKVRWLANHHVGVLEVR